jgi:hypothetical protein
MRTKQEIFKSRADECSRRAALATDPLIRYEFLNLAAHWLELAAIKQELEARRERASPEIVRKRETWISGQRKAFEKAMLGGALETTLWHSDRQRE